MNIKYSIKPMNISDANKIAKWTYEDEYSFYSMEKTKEAIDEFMDGSYYSVDRNDELIGYICFGENTQIKQGNKIGVYYDKDYTDIGLGIRPDLCGKGLGLDFVLCGMEFTKKELSAKKFRLTVASFNKRAIKVYERAGFKEHCSFVRESDNVEFTVMI